jgi:hypothetical protein
VVAPPPVDDEGQKLSWGRLLGLFGWTKILLLLLGGAALVLGAVNAWRAGESFGLLAVGAGFVLLALFLGPDWAQVDLALAAFKATFFREQAERLAAVERARDSTELRVQVEALQEELTTLSEKEQARIAAAERSAADWQVMIRRLRQRGIETSHSFRFDGTVELVLKWPLSLHHAAECRVTTPSGSVVSAAVHAVASDNRMVRTYSVLYPDQFGGSARLAPGLYAVTWCSLPRFVGDGSAVPRNAVARLVSRGGLRAVAYDGFLVGSEADGETSPPQPAPTERAAAEEAVARIS